MKLREKDLCSKNHKWVYERSQIKCTKSNIGGNDSGKSRLRSQHLSHSYWGLPFLCSLSNPLQASSRKFGIK